MSPTSSNDPDRRQDTEEVVASGLTPPIFASPAQPQLPQPFPISESTDLHLIQSQVLASPVERPVTGGESAPLHSQVETTPLQLSVSPRPETSAHNHPKQQSHREDTFKDKYQQAIIDKQYEWEKGNTEKLIKGSLKKHFGKIIVPMPLY